MSTEKRLKQNDLTSGTTDLGILKIVNNKKNGLIHLVNDITLDDGTIVQVENMTPKGFKNALNYNITKNKIEYKTPGEQYINSDIELDSVVRKYNDNYVNRQLLIEVLDENYILNNGVKVGSFQKDIKIDVSIEPSSQIVEGVEDVEFYDINLITSGMLKFSPVEEIKSLVDIEGNLIEDKIPSNLLDEDNNITGGFLFFKCLNSESIRFSTDCYQIEDNIYCYVLKADEDTIHIDNDTLFKCFIGEINVIEAIFYKDKDISNLNLIEDL